MFLSYWFPLSLYSSSKSMAIPTLFPWHTVSSVCVTHTISSLHICTHVYLWVWVCVRACVGVWVMGKCTRQKGVKEIGWQGHQGNSMTQCVMLHNIRLHPISSYMHTRTHTHTYTQTHTHTHKHTHTHTHTHAHAHIHTHTRNVADV